MELFNENFIAFLVDHLEYRRHIVEAWFSAGMPHNHIHDLWVMYQTLNQE
jgi:hypothetical protein